MVAERMVAEIITTAVRFRLVRIKLQLASTDGPKRAIAVGMAHASRDMSYDTMSALISMDAITADFTERHGTHLDCQTISYLLNYKHVSYLAVVL